MSKQKIATKVDSKGRITLPKEIREKACIEEGEVLFIYEVDIGQLKLIRAVEDPLVKLKEYTEKEFEKGETKSIRQYAKEKGINVDG
ncbi:MAG: AbrB/MazE/SpoVT family DNA-binding domain-containing protein [Halanaerobiales bacterium]|nr:AbrB/MazE/SpoVT family DNA-binding domain-containing protein [Halanaerobiales bacterium]